MSRYISQRQIALAADVAPRSVQRWQKGLPVRPAIERRICQAVTELEQRSAEHAAASAAMRERHQPRKAAR
jgi:hypothetical protein